MESPGAGARWTGVKRNAGERASMGTSIAMVLRRWVHRHRPFLGLAAAAIALGAAVLLYRGPLRGVIRGHVGDIGATMLVYALISLVWHARIALRAAGAFAIAAAIELGQTVWRGEGVAGELVVGSTFDPWDFVAYALGVAIAVVWERRGRRNAATHVTSGAAAGA